MFPRKILSAKKTLRFPQKIFLSYVMIIFLCVGVMGIFSYSVITKSIVNRTIDSNKEMLNQLRNTVDKLILGNIDKLSLTILQDSQNNPYISYYMKNSLDGHIVDTTKIFGYLNNLKAVNPMIYQIALFYAYNELLVSTEYIRFPGERYMMSMEEIKHVKELAASGESKYWIYESAANYMNEYAKQFDSENNSFINNQSKNLITFLRKVPDAKSDTGLDSTILISVSEELLLDLVKSSIPTNLGSIFIINDEGIIISHSNKEFLNTSITQLSYGRQIAHSTDHSGYFTANVDGIHYVISYAASEFNGWKYVTVKPTASFAESTQFLLQTLLIIAILTVLVGLAVSMLPSKKLYQPLKRLVDNCNTAISKAPFIHEHSRDEYAFIDSTLNSLSEKIGEQELKLKESYPVLKHYFIMNLVKGTYSDINELVDKMNLLKMELPYDDYMVTLLKLDKSNFTNDLRLYELVKLEITDDLQNILTGSDMKCFCTQDNDTILSVVNLRSTYTTVVKILNKVLHSYDEKLKDALGINLYVCIGGIAHSMDSACKSYREAEYCNEFYYIYPEKKIFRIDEVSCWSKPENNLIGSLTNDFSNTLKSQNCENTLKVIRELICTIKKEHCSYTDAFARLSKVLKHIEQFLEMVAIEIKDITSEDLCTHLNRFNNINKAEGWLVDLINKIFNYLESRHLLNNVEVVEKAKLYITQNIGRQDLSLNMVAEALYISPGYLSQLIKKNTGFSFVEYVTEYRLEMAKKMLLSSNLKIEDIANMYGYSSSQYFIRRFKHKNGYAPKEYKIMHCTKQVYEA